MPYKHQSDSYRMIGGVRYECWQDVPDTQAPALARAIRATGVRCRTFAMGDGDTRVFVRADAPAGLPSWDSDTDTITCSTPTGAPHDEAK